MTMMVVTKVVKGDLLMSFHSPCEPGSGLHDLKDGIITPSKKT